MDALTPKDVSTLLARLDGLISDAQSLQVDITRKTIERRALDQGIPQALGFRMSEERAPVAERPGPAVAERLGPTVAERLGPSVAEGRGATVAERRRAERRRLGQEPPVSSTPSE